MDFLYTQSVWAFRILLIFFTFFNDELNAVKLLDLSRICTYYFPFNTADSPVTPPDGFCTAMATFSEFGDHPPPANLDIKKFKGDLPYVYFFDARSISRTIRALIDENFQSFIVDINALITNHTIDVMVFDFVRSDMDEIERSWTDTTYQNYFKNLFVNMKNDHKDKLFGLKIHRNPNVNNHVFNVSFIDEFIDLYVVSSYGYERCKYRNHQRDMAPPPTADELKSTIDGLVSAGYNKTKLFLTIELVLKSWKNSYKEFPEEWSYSWMCQAHPGKKRKFCVGNLANYYAQGKVIRENQMPGVVIRALDCDDYNNICLCEGFPAIRSINDGLTGAAMNTSLTNCATFGVLPKNRPK